MLQNKINPQFPILLPQSSKSDDFDAERINEMLQLEGQCKIQKTTFIQISILKILFLTPLVVASVIGLLFLIWFKWFRVRVWYSECGVEEATYLYIEGTDKNDSIQKIQVDIHGKWFYFRNLKYRYKNFVHYPIAMNYEDKFQYLSSAQFLKRGLNIQQVDYSEKEFGRNEHPVEIPNYFAYMIDVLLQPLFLLQYIVCAVYFAQEYTMFSILILAFSFITTTINYILTYISYKKIKNMAEKIVDVRVLRNGEFKTIKSDQLVSGDLIDPQGEIMCDCIIVKGEVYVNESSLTGENIPIGKFQVRKLEGTKDSSAWLYEGSKIVQKRNSILALVIYTGYTTRRGRIIRKILAKNPRQTQIFTRTMIFFAEVFIVTMIIYFSTIALMKSKNISNIMIGFRFIDFLSWAVPPNFPIYFNVVYSFAIARLKNSGVLCIEPESTLLAGHIKVMCFDKTGTLTENAVRIHKILRFQNQNKIIDVTEDQKNPKNELIWKLFASCHTTKKINEQFMADEIDLRMFLYSKFDLIDSQDPQAKFQVIHKQRNYHLEVLRVNQFESKFQSMSVLVRDKSDGKYYAFIKGAPEKIRKNSVIKVDKEEELVKNFSIGGFRTIGLGYKTVKQNQIQGYLEGPRQIFQQSITSLGIVAFENNLKEGTRQTIDRLVLCGIQPKIITGDNIFIAVETGVRAGIIPTNSKVILLQGKNQKIYEANNEKTYQGTLLTCQNNTFVQQPIQLKQKDNYLIEDYPIVVDNDFLSIEPSPPLTKNMKIFARISPQNKALIIKKFKEMMNEQFQKRTFISKICGKLQQKVGMCGDGANDLMAIRQADVGIGFSDTDASYCSTFTIKNILDVDYIVRDSKATITNIVEIIRYYELISFLKVTSSVLLITDSTYLAQMQVIFYTFTTTVIYPIFQAMSKPSKTITNSIPNGNLMSPVNTLRFWGSSIIATMGFVGGYFYFKSTPVFKPNPNPVVDKVWYTVTYSDTCIFLCMLWPFAVYSFIFYIGKPWKEPIYKNYILLLLILINIGFTVALFYTTHLTQDILSILPITTNVVTYLMLISILACVVGLIYNLIITRIMTQSEETPIQYKETTIEDKAITDAKTQF